MTLRRISKLFALAALAASLFLFVGCLLPSSSGEDGSLVDAGGGADAADVADVAVDVAADVHVEVDVAPTYPTITVATFNVRLFFDTVCNSRRCGPGDFEDEPTQAEFEARAQELATAVEGLGADVVLLQEIENQDALDELQDALGGAYPVGVLGETGWSASVDVAVLARGELVDSRGYREDDALERPDGSKTEFAREFLRVDLAIDGEEVIVFSAHFTSKAGTDDPGRRLAEAQMAREIVDRVAADNDHALVVLGGDLNDTPDSEPLTALTGDGGYNRVASEKSVDDTYTYVYQWQAELIDHLLLAPTSGGGYVAGSVHSVHDRQPAGYGGSDHGALVADFEMR
jgi:predicted extracellular nuclease